MAQGTPLSVRMAPRQAKLLEDAFKHREGIGSIMPNLVVGNTNAPTIMIGEKAADMIRMDARA